MYLNINQISVDSGHESTKFEKSLMFKFEIQFENSYVSTE